MQGKNFKQKRPEGKNPGVEMNEPVGERAKSSARANLRNTVATMSPSHAGKKRSSKRRLP